MMPDHAAYTSTVLPNQALEPTTLAVTPCAPSRTSRASQGRGSSLTLGPFNRIYRNPHFCATGIGDDLVEVHSLRR